MSHLEDTRCRTARTTGYNLQTWHKQRDDSRDKNIFKCWRYSSHNNKYHSFWYFIGSAKDVSFLLSVIEQVEAERVGWG